MPKKQLLITGASSLLMLKLISILDPKEYEIIGISRKKQSTHNIKWIIGDIKNKEFVKNACKNIDIIIHAAAITHSFDPQPYYTVNYQATKNLVDIANTNGVEKFIFISSRTASKESGAYGYSKLQAEEYIKSNFKNWLIFRPSEIFGGSKNEGIDSLINDIRNKSFLPYPKGVKTKMYPIHLDDAITQIKNLLFSENKTVYINGNVGYLYPEFIKTVSQYYKKSILLIGIPKFIMFTLKHIMKLTKIKLSVTPDQIDRLYSKKSSSQEKTEVSISLLQYIEMHK